MDIAGIKKIIEQSGNNLHYKVVDFLRENGWYVSVSPYYADNFSEKPREIDIIAEKNYPIGVGMRGFLGTISIQLFIECKYIKDDTVFWFDERNNNKALEFVLNNTPLEDPSRYSMTSKHHYLSGLPVAKLFASAQNKGQSQDGEVFFKAITQSLNGMISYSGSGSLLPSGFNQLRNDMIKTTLRYPLIITDSFGKLYRHDVIKKGDPEEISENFEIETQYAYFDHSKKQRKEYFLIDVCNLDTLKRYLEMIEKSDLGAVKEKMSWDASMSGR